MGILKPDLVSEIRGALLSDAYLKETFGMLPTN